MVAANINIYDKCARVVIEVLRFRETKCTDRVRDLYSSVTDNELIRFSAKNRLVPVVAHGLMDIFGPDKIPSYWHEAHEISVGRISSYMRELDRIALILEKMGIPVVALKNGGIARGIYKCPGCCPMGDIDTLIEKSSFRKAHRILLGEGYIFKFRSPNETAELEYAEQSGGSEYRKTLPNGDNLWLELQWRPIAGRWIRSDQEPPGEELIMRSKSVPGTAVKILAPEDNLLQVALHTAKHSYVRAPGFRLHLDVDRIVRHTKINWEVFLRRVVGFQVKTATYFSLAIPKALFDTPIPDELINALRPQAWKEALFSKWLQKMGFFNPDDRKFNNTEFILFNTLLYDDINGLKRSIFPDGSWMREHYGIKSNHLLPLYYAKRIANLAWHRIL